MYSVVLWMDKCVFCKQGHWTDQECKNEIEVQKRRIKYLEDEIKTERNRKSDLREKYNALKKEFKRMFDLYFD